MPQTFYNGCPMSNTPPIKLSWLDGLATGPRAARYLIARPMLWKYSVGAVLVMSLLFGALTWLLVARAVGWVGSAWAVPDGELARVGRVLVQIAVGAVATAGAALLTALASGAIAAPFNDRLSAHVEELELGPSSETFSWSVFAGDVAMGVWHTVLNAALWLVLVGGSMLLGLVPVVGLVLGPLCGVLATAAVVALEALDYPLSRRRLSWDSKIRYVLSRRRPALGFGLAMTAMLSVPVLNFVAAPVAVVGGTLLFCALGEPAPDGGLPVGRPRHLTGNTNEE